ncbi:MAG: hypothetical protein ABI416_07865 [Ginsengibacter sp.]
MDEKKNQSEDYITISGFKKFVTDSLRYFFWFLSYVQLVIVKCWYFLLTGLFFGLITGYIYYVSKPTLYKVSMLVAFNELNKRSYAEMLDQLNKPGTSGRGYSLASILQIPQSIAGKVLFIDTRNMNNDPLDSDTSTRFDQPFKIIVGLKDNFLSDTLQNAIINYLNNGNYLKKLKVEQEKIYQQKIIFIDGELRKLDSLKLSYNKFLASPAISATFYNNAFNPADLFVQSADLASQREITSKWLALNTSSVYLVDGFKTTVSPQSLSLKADLLIFGSVGVLIGFIVAFLSETKRRVGGTYQPKY